MLLADRCEQHDKRTSETHSVALSVARKVKNRLHMQEPSESPKFHFQPNTGHARSSPRRLFNVGQNLKKFPHLWLKTISVG